MLRQLLAITALAAVQGALPDIYAVSVGFGPMKKRTISEGFKVNPTTGEWSQISENFVYVGSSAKWDGVNAFDEANGLFYWATGFGSNLVYSINVTSGSLQAPIDLYSAGIITLTFDQYNGELIITDVPQNMQNVSRMTRYSATDVTEATLPSSVVPGRAVVDPAAGHSFINFNPIAKQLQYLAPTGNMQKSVTLKNECAHIDFLFFDKNHDLWATEISIVNGTVKNSITKIDTSTGSCSTPVDFSHNQVLAFTSNVAQGELWYGSVNDTGSYLQSYNPATRASTCITNKAGLPLTDIAVKY
eukprot:TRINITY_DN27962_c0_g1_i1.p1 TRINITY_DN27962_c0_g1~~TRINITY_DN27962_c0_g1_i1.p1  ORF type:complete len:302 (+),score=67.11 TRINITY_DN27962_c0_g1_i1:89-994(+)